MALIASTIGAICERGTVASSNIVVGFNRASADRALRRAVRSASASVSSFAIRTSTAFIERQTLAMFSISRLTTSGGPSCSINKIAFTSVGKPICANSSTTSIVGWSKNSSVAGMILFAIIEETARAASLISSYSASIVSLFQA